MDIFVTVLLLLAVLFAAYYTTRLLSVRAKSITNLKNMKLIESLPLWRDRQIVLISVGRKVLVIGITAQSMEILTEIGSDEIQTDEGKAKAAGWSFKEMLSTAQGAFRKKKAPADRQKPVTENQEQTLDSMIDDLENRIKKKRSET